MPWVILCLCECAIYASWYYWMSFWGCFLCCGCVGTSGWFFTYVLCLLMLLYMLYMCTPCRTRRGSAYSCRRVLFASSKFVACVLYMFSILQYKLYMCLEVEAILTAGSKFVDARNRIECSKVSKCWPVLGVRTMSKNMGMSHKAIPFVIWGHIICLSSTWLQSLRKKEKDPSIVQFCKFLV